MTYDSHNIANTLGNSTIYFFLCRDKKFRRVFLKREQGVVTLVGYPMVFLRALLVTSDAWNFSVC